MFDVVNLGSDLSISAGDAFSVSGMADFAGQFSTDANMIADLSLGGPPADGFVAGFYRYHVVSHNSNYFDDNLSRFCIAVASLFAIVLFINILQCRFMVAAKWGACWVNEICCSPSCLGTLIALCLMMECVSNVRFLNSCQTSIRWGVKE